MTKKIHIIIIFLLIFQYSSSQTKATGISFLGGYVGEKSVGGILLTSIYFERNIYEFGVYHNSFLNINYKEVKHSVTGLKVGYMYNALVSRYNFFIIGVGLGANVGMSKINNVENYPLISKEGLEYGFYGALALDIYISDKTSFVIRAEENYSINSTTGKLNPFIGGGFKFNL